MKLGEVVRWAPSSQGTQPKHHPYIVLTEPAVGKSEGVLINLTDRLGRPVPYPGLAVCTGFRSYVTKDSVANAADSFLCNEHELQVALTTGDAVLLAPPGELFDMVTLERIARCCVNHPAIAFEVSAEIKRQWGL